MIIVQLEGNVGVGKSTAMHEVVARRRETRIVTEPVGGWTEHLRGLYESGSSSPWPMLLQMLIEGTRMEALFRAIRHEQEACALGGGRPLVVVERSSASSSIFSRLTLSSAEGLAFDMVQTRYREAVQTRSERARVVTVYLRASPQTCYERVRARGRDVEEQMTVTFLQDLHDAHDSMFLKRADLVIDCNDKTCAEVASVLCDFLSGLK